MKTFPETLTDRLNEHAATFTDLVNSHNEDDRLAAKQLAAIREFANVFDIDLTVPEGHEEASVDLCISSTQKYDYPERPVTITYRISADLLNALSNLPKAQPLATRYEMLEKLASLWGHTDCAHIRSADEVRFTINDPTLGFILHAWCALEE